MTSKFFKVFLLFLMVSVISLGAFAQNNNSTIKGTVKDAGGAVVSGATVTLTNIGTSHEVTTKSGADGFLRLCRVVAGKLQIDCLRARILRMGRRADFARFSSRAGRCDIQCRQCDDTSHGEGCHPGHRLCEPDVVGREKCDRDRNPSCTKPKHPECTWHSARAWLRAAMLDRAAAIRASTASPVDLWITWWMDRLCPTGSPMNCRPTRSRLQHFQEVKIITASGDAQYGRPGLIELVTKSGTNQFHGQAYELNQNNHLQARAYNSGPTIPFLQHNEWGAQLGGPVWIPKVYNGRNKTFFFFDAEWIQQNSNQFESIHCPHHKPSGRVICRMCTSRKQRRYESNSD